MIISCLSCQTSFKIDETRLSPDGTKVRCSKCGHVWHMTPGEQPAASAERQMPVMPSADEFVADVSPAETPSAEQPANRVEPVLSARDENDRENRAGDQEEPKIVDDSDEGEAPETEEFGPDGLTDGQRAKLAAARQKKPSGGFRTKVLLILLIVLGVLLAALYMIPPDILEKVNQASQQPADVGEVDAMPVPAEPEKGGHIVGGDPPPQPAQ